MTHVLIESAWWLFFAQINAVAWFKISCMVVAQWAAFDWERRL